jgi:hypothetical protein
MFWTLEVTLCLMSSCSSQKNVRLCLTFWRTCTTVFHTCSVYDLSHR